MPWSRLWQIVGIPLNLFKYTHSISILFSFSDNKVNIGLGLGLGGRIPLQKMLQSTISISYIWLFPFGFKLEIKFKICKFYRKYSSSTLVRPKNTYRAFSSKVHAFFFKNLLTSDWVNTLGLPTSHSRCSHSTEDIIPHPLPAATRSQTLVIGDGRRKGRTPLPDYVPHSLRRSGEVKGQNARGG